MSSNTKKMVQLEARPSGYSAADRPKKTKLSRGQCIYMAAFIFERASYLQTMGYEPAKSAKGEEQKEFIFSGFGGSFDATGTVRTLDSSVQLAFGKDRPDGGGVGVLPMWLNTGGLPFPDLDVPTSTVQAIVTDRGQGDAEPHPLHPTNFMQATPMTMEEVQAKIGKFTERGWEVASTFAKGTPDSAEQIHGGLVEGTVDWSIGEYIIQCAANCRFNTINGGERDDAPAKDHDEELLKLLTADTSSSSSAVPVPSLAAAPPISTPPRTAIGKGNNGGGRSSNNWNGGYNNNNDWGGGKRGSGNWNGNNNGGYGGKKSGTVRMDNNRRSRGRSNGGRSDDRRR